MAALHGRVCSSVRRWLCASLLDGQYDDPGTRLSRVVLTAPVPAHMPLLRLLEGGLRCAEGVIAGLI
jgi:hypothetical protein